MEAAVMIFAGIVFAAGWASARISQINAEAGDDE